MSGTTAARGQESIRTVAVNDNGAATDGNPTVIELDSELGSERCAALVRELARVLVVSAMEELGIARAND